MSKRKLKRQLNLAQVVMLGAGGTIAAEIFVLTGYAAGIAGPAAILAFLVGGLLSYTIALNYSELATTYPVTGGALTYVREAYGTNLLSFLVGSMDSLSSTFYAALSAVGFAYSLQIFIPTLPIVPIAIAVIVAFTILNILGASEVGNIQIVLGGILLFILSVYVVLGLTRPDGFQWQVFMPGGTIFIHQDAWANISRMLATVALVYSAYIGFEVIADDAEEIRTPQSTIPVSILLSLTIVMLVYVLVGFVTLGTLSWQEIAGSETALTDAANRFLPGWGAALMGIAGIIATLTSVNTAMLSATREAFTLSRHGTLPRFLSRLSGFRTPYGSILVIGVISSLIASIGLVDFLSYVSSSGYLFVLFWSNLSMIRLRKRFPDIERPFKVPFFPLTAYLGAATCLIIIAFTDRMALLFGVGVLTACATFYYAYPLAARFQAWRISVDARAKHRILIPVANPRNAQPLVRLGTLLAKASEDTSICVFTVIPASSEPTKNIKQRLMMHLTEPQQTLLDSIARDALVHNVPLYTRMRAATGVANGILDETKHNNIKLILAGWAGPLDSAHLTENPIKVVLQEAHTNVAVLLNREMQQIKHILVPVGGGPHSRLALRFAYEIAEQENAQITTLHIFSEMTSVEEIEDKMLHLEEIIEDELGFMPRYLTARVNRAESVRDGIVYETTRQPYDLLLIGASEEWISQTRLFGSVSDWIADRVPCSVLLVRRYEPATIAWIRRNVKIIGGEYGHKPV